ECESDIMLKVTEGHAIQWGRELYGLKATARSLAGEYDQNFHLTSENDGEFVLKVMHPDRKRDFIDLQCQALAHLARRAPSLSLARACPGINGEIIASVEDSEGAARFVWMLGYVPGDLMARANPHTPEMLLSLGRFLGQMDRALDDFSHPAAHRQMKWD